MEFGFALVAASHGTLCLNLIIVFIICLDAFLKVTEQFFLLLWIN